jgi:chemotaxis protein CheZ
MGSVMSRQQNETVYKELSSSMRQGLKDIYRQISTVSSERDDSGKNENSATDALFHEASTQLGEVLKTTEDATMSIMGVVEKHLELQAECSNLLKEMLSGARTTKKRKERLKEIIDFWGQDLTNVLTTLSFQDITGQRIKKVVNALNQIERRVVELYVSSGLVMEGAEREPDRDAASLHTEAKQAVENFRNSRKSPSRLKGPDADGCSQNAIDDMLSQLGL